MVIAVHILRQNFPLAEANHRDIDWWQKEASTEMSNGASVAVSDVQYFICEGSDPGSLLFVVCS